MTIEAHPRICKNPGCTNPVPPRKPGHKARLTCSDDCRKAASRIHLRDEARRREEAARQQRQARWQPFLPTTRSMLSRVEALSGAALAEQLAEAIQSEADAALKRDQVRGKEQANATHYTVGRKVREFIINELGGTAPEALPTPTKSIQQLEREEQNRLKHRGQLSLFDPPPEEPSKG